MQKYQNAKIQRIGWKKIASTAAIVLIIGVASMLKFSINGYSTSIGQKTTIDLPDGSKVTLNAETEMQYSTLDFGLFNNRSLKLKGEAYFEVQKGADFMVETENGTVQVLGTTFNVFSRGDRLNVHCFTGKVEVSLESNDSRVIEGGNSAESLNKKFLSPNNPSEFSDLQPKWIHNESVFSEDPLIEVLQEFERQYEIKFIYPNSISSHRFTGGFPHSDFDTAFEILKTSIEGYNFTLEGKKVTLSPK